MAIDFVVSYDCVPKQTFTQEGILDRLKERDRARTVIDLYREGGDERHPTLMEFELSRVNAEGVEETRVVNVQSMLDRAAELDSVAAHCAGCPANLVGEPFGCYGVIQYPISAAAERWLLDRLPGIEEPLIWLLLRQGVQELGYDGAAVAPLRADPTYFEERRLPGRNMVEFIFTANQVFEMLFLTGAVQPAHAGMLLLLFGAIPRSVEADQIVRIMNRQLHAAEIKLKFPFQYRPEEGDDLSITQMKIYLYALYNAWLLNVPVGLDV